MSIPFNGTRTRSGGIISAIVKQLRSLTLKPVKSINVKFDPFHNAFETRNFLFHVTIPKVIATNCDCSVKAQIVSDSSEPEISIQLISGDKVVFKSTHLTALNILELYNKHITPLSLPEPETASENEVGILKKKKTKKVKRRFKEGSKRRGIVL